MMDPTIATSAQNDSTSDKAERTTTVKIYGYHQEGYESECNGGDRRRMLGLG